MNCPSCGGDNSKVLESRIAEAGDAIRRRRECLDCSERFTTYERIEKTALWVTKYDGRQEQFSSTKLLRGIEIACSKRDIATELLEQIVIDVETLIRMRGSRDVTSCEVGELALAGLVRIDEAAAIRFASVIERAESVEEFRDVLDRMAAAARKGSAVAVYWRHLQREITIRSRGNEQNEDNGARKRGRRTGFKAWRSYGANQTLFY